MRRGSIAQRLVFTISAVDSVHTTDATLGFSGEKTFNLIKRREDTRLGLRVEGDLNAD
jgi:hypothetical protein